MPGLVIPSAGDTIDALARTGARAGALGARADRRGQPATRVRGTTTHYASHIERSVGQGNDSCVARATFAGAR